MKKAKFTDLPSGQWRIKDEVVEVDGVPTTVKIKQRREVYRLDTGWITFDLDRIQEWMSEYPLDGAEFEIEQESDYGGETSVLYLKGWRDATDQEYATALKEAEQAHAQMAERARLQLENLKKANPELFKEVAGE